MNSTCIQNVFVCNYNSLPLGNKEDSYKQSVTISKVHTLYCNIKCHYIQSAHIVSIPIKEQCVFVCWFVGLSAFYRPHDICPLCGAASEYSERAEEPPRAAPRARAGKRIHLREHARACRTTSQRKNRCADAFPKTISRTRARMLSYT